MKIGVLGAGSLGSAIGGLLAKHGNEVVLVNRNADFCQVVNRFGLTLQEGGLGGTTSVVYPQALTEVPPQSAASFQSTPFELLLVVVKSKDTESMIRSALPWMSEGTVVMSLQNGMGHEEVMGSIMGSKRLLAGKTYVGGLITAPGVVTIGHVGKITTIGELAGRITPRAMAIARVFCDAGLETRVSDNIVGAIWDKLLANVATGAIAGITRLAYGKLYQVPELEAIASAAVTEAICVARAKGIQLSIHDPLEAWHKAGLGLPFEFKASMLQTIERQSITEIDYINGAVVQAGRACGVPTPINETLVGLIKGIERGFTERLDRGISTH